MPRSYIAIDLKPFCASVECADRKLDPLTTNLVVADESRTDKTICLAVSPVLKTYGIPGRPRLFGGKFYRSSFHLNFIYSCEKSANISRLPSSRTGDTSLRFSSSPRISTARLYLILSRR